MDLYYMRIDFSAESFVHKAVVYFLRILKMHCAICITLTYYERNNFDEILEVHNLNKS